MLTTPVRLTAMDEVIVFVEFVIAIVELIRRKLFRENSASATTSHVNDMMVLFALGLIKEDANVELALVLQVGQVLIVLVDQVLRHVCQRVAAKFAQAMGNVFVASANATQPKK